MMNIIIVVLISACLILLFKVVQSSKGQGGALFRQRATSSAHPLSIEHVGPGGVIHLSHIGTDMEDFDITILARHEYREQGFSWHELEGDRGKGKVWIDIENDDELDVSIVLRKLKLADIGIGKNDLARMDDEEEGRLSFEGKTYHYDDSGKATFLKNGEAANAESFYYWDFECEDGKHYMSVERWEDNSHDVSLSETVKLSQITVFRLDDTQGNEV